MIRLLLLAYPPAWRRRYGQELGQLIEDSGLDVGTAVDLVRSGLVERVRSLRAVMSGGTTMAVGSAYRHPTLLALVALAVLAPTLVFVVGSLLAYQVGIGAVQAPIETTSRWLADQEVANALLVLAPAVALALAVVPLVRLDLRTTHAGREAIVGLRMRAVNLVVAALALAIGGVLAWYFVVERLTANAIR